MPQTSEQNLSENIPQTNIPSRNTGCSACAAFFFKTLDFSTKNREFCSITRSVKDGCFDS